MSEGFSERLSRIQSQKETAVCVGLDPDPERLPHPLRDGRLLSDAVREFCATIMENTAPYACAFKFNFAFFEALGPAGLTVLSHVAGAAPDDVLLIADAKRGDIGNSARFYAKSVYNDLEFDACTVSPYLGRDSVMPFLEYGARCTFVLARTSNDGAADLQEACTCGNTPLYRRVAEKVSDWSGGATGTGGLVVGATAPDALDELRTTCPKLPFLIPGVGAQGGDPTSVMRAARTEEGPVLVNSSRSIIYADSGENYGSVAGRAARELRDQLRA